MNLQDCVWENHCRLIMRTILQEEEAIFYSIIILVHKFIRMPQAMKIPAAKAAVDKEWEKLKSGSCAVFAKQGSSASQMTAAKVMVIISRLPGCDGQAADAVSAYTHVKMEDAPKLLKIPKSECPDIWIRLPRHKWPKSVRKTQSFLLSGIGTVILQQDCNGKGNLRKSY